MSLECGPAPRYYRLTIDAKNRYFTFYPHPTFTLELIKRLSTIDIAHPEMSSFRPFPADQKSGNWGFGTLSRFRRVKDRIVFTCPLATGSSEDDLPWDEAKAVTRNLAILVKLADFLAHDNEAMLRESTTDPQLFSISCLGDRDEMNGAAFLTVLSRPLFNFTCSLESKQRQIVSHTMRAVYERGAKLNEISRRQKMRLFFILIDGTNIALSVLGNACDIGTDGMEMHYFNPQSDEGIELVPHNIDSLFQQQALIAGLCRLAQMYEMRPVSS